MNDVVPDPDPTDPGRNQPPEAELAAFRRRQSPPGFMPLGDSGLKSVRWVRVSDLAGELGGGVVGRGIDLHAALSLRARRLPIASVTAASDRLGITHTARSGPPTYSRELPHRGRTR